MRRVLAALVAVGLATALVPAATPASASGTAWVDILRRDVDADIDARRLVEVAGVAHRGTRPATEPGGDPGGLYGQDCIDPVASRLALRRASVTAGSGRVAFAAEGCDDWSSADLAGGAVAWRIAVPGGSGDADHTVAVFGEGLEAVVTSGGDEVRFRGRGTIDDAGRLSVTVPLEAVGGETEFGLVVVSTDGDGRADALTRHDGRPLLHPTTPETAVAGAVTVTADPGAFEGALAAARAAGFTVATPIPALGAFGVEAVHPTDHAALRSLPGVTEVRPATPAAVMQGPTARHYADQWALHGGYGIRAETAWGHRTGSGLTVAVVDSGVDGRRPDFGDRVLRGQDTWTGERFPAGANSDLTDHGTGVAGIIAADGGNQVAGVDWTARILPYRFTNAAGEGPVIAVADAIVRATDAGADVINLSLGARRDDRALAEAVRYAADRGVVLVAASGNAARDGSPRMYPAAYPEVIAVGATTRLGTRAPYSNIGSHVHIVAPGGAAAGGVDRDILVLGRSPSLLTDAGTSFAAPHVAGATSLYLAGHPSASPAAVAMALAETAVDAGPPGKDPEYGHGRLDLGALIRREPRVGAAIAPACPPARVARPGFEDVFTSTHYEAIACLSWWRLTDGVTPTRYAPQGKVERGQMATFLVRMLREAGVDVPPPTDQGFADVRGTHADAINQLAALGVASGRTATQFAPRAAVTREQMATFIAKTHEVATGRRLPAGPGVGFTDIADSRHREWILALASAGVVSGTGPTTYSPKDAVTRAQMASFLMRQASLLVETGHATVPAR